ncbi:hypothetical protein [Pontibacter sp. G13]|uniref:hypothetical protein n=1 Tax=Pontibacter sp. G13 TaxID=3074898 RepID=UPI002889C3CE|nr:hypothetical protein [Pontibacter sp. G13]WNJ19570.1 hypothetical protein RJD25_03695 [Pontibacter sp. G13]
MTKQTLFTTSIACALLALVTISSCDQGPVFSEIPAIEFIDIQPKEVRQWQDSILVTFRFEDGDGDLGEANDTSASIALIDSRVNDGISERDATQTFRLPNLVSDAKNPSIQGEITVRIPFTVIRPPALAETIRYEIRLWDQAGHAATPINGDSDDGVFTDYIIITQ